MIVISGSIPIFKVRTAQSASYNSSNWKLELVNEDTNVLTNITNVTASYDFNGYLNVRASASIALDTIHAIKIFQTTGSVSSSLYLGELMRVTGSADVITAPPFISYTGSLTEYIIF
jgi:hypothetical protein